MPSYNYWESRLNAGIDKDDPVNFSIVMIYYIWSMWVFNMLFMCIILLNLLIAVMSSVYEEALQDNFVSKY